MPIGWVTDRRQRQNRNRDTKFGAGGAPPVAGHQWLYRREIGEGGMSEGSTWVRIGNHDQIVDVSWVRTLCRLAIVLTVCV